MGDKTIVIRVLNYLRAASFGVDDYCACVAVPVGVGVVCLRVGCGVYRKGVRFGAAVGETDVYGSVFGVVAVVGRIAACAGVVQAVGVGAAFYVWVVCAYGTAEVVCHDATACYSLLLSFNALVLFLLYVPA